MKRHSALIPLSREHHQMLLLAQLLKRDAPPYKDLPQDAPGKAAYARQVWTGVVEPHFSREEQHLYPVLLENEKVAELAQPLLAEHEQLRRRYTAVQENPQQVEMQDTLGRMLEAHIRAEERQLFQAAQAELAEATLVALEPLLRAEVDTGNA